MSCRRPSLGPHVEKYATGRVQSRLKNRMTRHASRSPNSKMETASVPSENVEVYIRERVFSGERASRPSAKLTVMLAASHSQNGARAAGKPYPSTHCWVHVRDKRTLLGTRIRRNALNPLGLDTVRVELVDNCPELLELCPRDGCVRDTYGLDAGETVRA